MHYPALSLESKGKERTPMSVSCACRARANRVWKKETGAAKLQYAQFLHALQLIAIKRGTGFEEVVNKVLNNSQRKRGHTMADFIILDACGASPGTGFRNEQASRTRQLERPCHQSCKITSRPELNRKAGLIHFLLRRALQMIY